MYTYNICRLPVQVPAYEIVDMPSQSDSSNKQESNPHTASKQKQPQVPSSPHEYLTPFITTNQQVIKCDQQVGHGDQTDAHTATNEKNTYQPLIPPRPGASKDEYQSLTQHTLPKKFNLRPVIPPKPDANRNN